MSMDIQKAILWQRTFKKTFEVTQNSMMQEAGEACDFTIAALQELQQYHQIGTIDECKEAREMMMPKKPD